VTQVNTRWILVLASYTGQTEARVRERLLGDPCFNIVAAGATLRVCLDETPGDVLRAIGNYHSHTPDLNAAYLRLLIEQAWRMFGR
jgi:hypothetical protein